MKIKINSKDKILPEGINIHKLLENLGHKDSTGIAIAIDSEVVPREEWEERNLKEGDNLLIIQAACGG